MDKTSTSNIELTTYDKSTPKSHSLRSSEISVEIPDTYL
jgi:hypothetical protein